MLLTSSTVCTSINRLTAKQEDVLQTVVRLDGGKGDMSMTAAVSKERNWSAWRRTYTSLRNRLSIETADKL
eukprot:46159-Pelagomonas_calceolata.AAC.1